jgi:hypothetical protein
MRYGNASMICMLTVGVVYGLSGGCGNSGNSSVFNGTGGLTSGTGTNTGTATGGLTSGSTGSGIMTTGTGGTLAGGSGTGGPSSDAACANQVSDSSAIPSDIFIMLDKSGSMNCAAAENGCTNPPMTLVHPTRWEAVTTAINSFVSAPANANIGVGIQFFSLGGNNGQCNIAGHRSPVHERDGHLECDRGQHAGRQHADRSCSHGRPQLRHDLHADHAGACRVRRVRERRPSQ